jgi:glyoxylase-like metal-dependent hydrolase (beta-lactamase superfamily II)
MTRIWPLPCEGLGNGSYLAEVGSGVALAVDPGRDPRPYLGLAATHRLRVAFTADTHVHADFVSGGRELAGLGARLLAPAGAGLSFPHQELRDGEDLDLGGLTLRALATPGHTPEHLSYLLLDGTRPVAVFTGGALIVGGVARTDLAGPARAEEWTRVAYRSARALLGLPPGLAAYPTHGPGSFCAAGETGEHISTIGQERAGNPLLAGNDEDAFTRQVLERLGSYPAYFARMPGVNRRGAPRHGTSRPGPGRPGPRARRPAGHRGRDDRRRQADRGIRRGSHPQVAVERAAPGVRDLAGLAGRPGPAADRRARSEPGPRGACGGGAAGRL